MLVTSIFSFSHNLFKSPLSWGRKKSELCCKDLTHSHTMTPFDAPKIYSCRKHCEKRRNCLLQAISPFLTMFSTQYDTYFSFSMHFKMSSAISFNLDQSKILLSGNGLMGKNKSKHYLCCGCGCSVIVFIMSGMKLATS